MKRHRNSKAVSPRLREDCPQAIRNCWLEIGKINSRSPSTNTFYKTKRTQPGIIQDEELCSIRARIEQLEQKCKMNPEQQTGVIPECSILRREVRGSVGGVSALTRNLSYQFVKFDKKKAGKIVSFW